MNAAVQQSYAHMTTEMLFEEYRRTEDPAYKWEIALRYTGLIKSIALQIRGVFCSFAQLDDIINEGIIVLASAVDKYNPEKGQFDTYVAKRVRGMIIDLARQQDWVPRTVRKRAKEIDQAAAELFNTLGRFPTDREVAGHLGITEEEYQDAMGQSAMHNILSLEEFFEKCEQYPAGLAGEDTADLPEHALQSRELLSVLTDAIGSLKQNEQMVLSLYYQKDLKMKDIATVMGISAPRVSQIYAKAIQKLRVLLTQYMREGQ